MSTSLPNDHIPVAERPNSVDIEQLIDKSGCSKVSNIYIFPFIFIPLSFDFDFFGYGK